MSRNTWIPNQHGAWAMLITPVLVGAMVGSVRPLQLVLLVAWLAAYCTNFFLSLALKTRRWARYRRQLLAYGTTAAACALPLLADEPRLLWLAIPSLAVFLINIYFVRERNERSWINDIAGIVLAAAVGFGAFLVGYDDRDPDQLMRAGRAIAVVSLYFVGTVFYVKTMIRERGVTLWMRLSVGFHTCLAVSLALMRWWPVTAIAVAALVRSIMVPKLRWTPKQIGVFEIAFTVAFGAAVLL